MTLFTERDEGDSLPFGIEHLREWLSRENDLMPIRRVVDFGCGGGNFAKAIMDVTSVSEIVGVDVWSPSLARLQEDGKPYNRVVKADMCDVILGDKRNRIGEGWDLWLFGDCLEHVTKKEAVQILESEGARLVAARIPVGPWPQEGLINPLEGHVWSFYPKDLRGVNRRVIDWVACTCLETMKIGHRTDIPEETRDENNKFFNMEELYIANILFGEL